MNSKFCRYSFGFLLLSLILSAFYFESSVLKMAISIFLIIVSIKEYREIFKEKEIYIHKFLPEIFGILFALIFCFPINQYAHKIITPLFIAGIITSFAVTLLKNKKPYFITSLATIMSFLMVFCGLYVIKITYQFVIDKCWYIILAYFFAILLGDFVASKIGPKFTKKLAPEISPNKTIGGAIASLMTACLICSTLIFTVNFTVFESLFFGFVISIFAQIGDLAISSIKRDLGVKHSGTLFLEYGGILDRMDAFIFSAPAAYYCLCLFS